ncbi:MAG: HAD family hydrolase [Limnochordia bacterium]|jgi:FMN phosphatase YigB (HAD superfamily)
MTRDHIRLVLFDLGGVLVELAGLPTPLQRLRGRLTDDEIWARWLTSPTVREFETGQIEPHAFAIRMIGEMSLDMDPDRLLEELAAWTTGLFPGALELVDSIPPGYERGILSNCNALHWARLTEDTGLDKKVNLCFSSHLTGKVKPDEGAFLHVIDATGYAPNEIFFLDDNRLNVEAAVKLGINARQVRGIDEARQALIQAGILG